MIVYNLGVDNPSIEFSRLLFDFIVTYGFAEQLRQYHVLPATFFSITDLTCWVILPVLLWSFSKIPRKTLYISLKHGDTSKTLVENLSPQSSPTLEVLAKPLWQTYVNCQHEKPCQQGRYFVQRPSIAKVSLVSGNNEPLPVLRSQQPSWTSLSGHVSLLSLNTESVLSLRCLLQWRRCVQD